MYCFYRQKANRKDRSIAAAEKKHRVHLTLACLHKMAKLSFMLLKGLVSFERIKFEQITQ